MPTTDWIPATLGLLLPLDVGQRVVIVGAEPPARPGFTVAGFAPVFVVAAADHRGLDRGRREGAMVISDDGRLPLDDGSVDHMVFLHLGPQYRALLGTEVGRVCRAGASVFVGATNRWRFPHRPHAVTIREGRNLLAEAGLESVRAFGVRHGLSNPRHLVALEPGPLSWYLRSAYLPRSRRGAFGVHAGVRALDTSVMRMLFPALGFWGRVAATPRRVQQR